MLFKTLLKLFKTFLKTIFLKNMKGCNGLKYSNLLSGHAFYRMMNMRDEYLIHKTHRTFRAWLLPFALLADNLNAISCICNDSWHQCKAFDRKSEFW